MERFGAWLRELIGSTLKSTAKVTPEQTAKERIQSDSGEELIPGPSSPETSTRSRSLQRFAWGNNDLAVAMYRQLHQQTENLFFSPFSIRSALGMTYAGAGGATAMQISDVCRFSPDDESAHTDNGDIIRRLSRSGSSKCPMEVANSLWGPDGMDIKAEFLDLIARYYECDLNLVDFRHGPDAARVTINRWAGDKTGHRIREILSGKLDPDTGLILVNAVYFKGIWEQQFSEADTRTEPFYLEDGATVQAPLMYREDSVQYQHVDGYQAVNLGYRGSGLSMLVLLPDQKDGLHHLEERLTARMLHNCVAHLSGDRVKLYLPRFKITWGTVDLANQLVALGMPVAFDRSQADFSGINGHKSPDEEALCISHVFHKAFVEVNEEGTEAAAATEVEMELTGPSTRSYDPPPVPVFRADHPFLFAILDRVSGAILFLGRMTDPTQQS